MWGDGTNWIPIDLNANILARNIYFLQIKESLTHSALVFNVSSIKWGEKKKKTHVAFWEERESRDAALSAEGVFPKIFIKKYMILKFIRKSTWKQNIKFTNFFHSSEQ